jgi:hypothetical protein
LHERTSNHIHGRHGTARPTGHDLGINSAFSAGGKVRIPNNAAVPKWFKTVIGVLLLPACVGAAEALWLVLRATGKAETLWVAIISGFACWLVIFLLLPKPMWAYVFGHELTHVLWTWLLGGRVKKFRASSKGGHVVVTKNNFLIALAPYFFPLYAIFVVLLFLAGDSVWNWKPYTAWFHLLLGASYGFHVTLTWHILKSAQSDITDQGYLFSAIVIFLGNVCVLLLAIPLLSGQLQAMTGLRWWAKCTLEVVQRLAQLRFSH